jgi:glycerol uptake facilitator-like aquaporin
MHSPEAKTASPAGNSRATGKAALIHSVGGQRGYADWTNPDHRLRRLLSEFIGMAGLTFILSGCAAVLARYGGDALQPWQTVFVLSVVSALWLVVAVYFLGDISAHFNPATTLAFALRRDMGWAMAGAYWAVQLVAAAGGSLLARAFFGAEGHLAATMPQPGHSWQATGFEAVITFGLVLMILNMANGPKLNGPFIPLAVGAYIMARGTMGGPFDGASMNPARSFGPDLAIGDLSTWWVYVIGPLAGALVAVGVAYVLRGPAKAQEAIAAMGTPLHRADRTARRRVTRSIGSRFSPNAGRGACFSCASSSSLRRPSRSRCGTTSKRLTLPRSRSCFAWAKRRACRFFECQPRAAGR